jgi:hypothetical protein
MINQEVLSRAKTIIQRDVAGDPIFNKGRELNGVQPRRTQYQQQPVMTESYNVAYNEADELSMDRLYNTQRTTQQMPGTLSPYVSNSAISSSKLPKEILESMKSNPIEIPNFMSNTSVLDRFGDLSGLKQNNTQVPTMINENIQPIQRTTQQIPLTNAGGVDYSLIRMIVKETIEEILAEKKTTLNESAEKRADINAMRVLGNKIQYVDTDGNLYEGELKFKKNVRKK